MQLKADGIISKEFFHTSSGIPQGSHMGPLLYLLFCADLHTCFTDDSLFISSYADDTKFMKQITKEGDVDTFQQTIDEFCLWAVANKLQINAAKTNHISFQRITTKKFAFQIYIGNRAIEQPETVRDLSVLFDQKMNFKAHKKSVMEKANCIFGAAIRFSREINSKKAIIRIMNTYINPVIMYASVVWLDDNHRAMYELEAVQRKCTRYMLGTPFRPF